MPVRLNPGGAYISDITQLRRDIRANGSLANLAHIAVTHQNHPGTQVTLIMNMAFQPNSSMPQPNASLYILGFTNGTGTFTFNVVPWPVAAVAGVALVQDGSYASLGYPAPPLPQLSMVNLGNALMAVAGYAGGVPGAPVLTGLAQLIIAVSEAARFEEVAQGVAHAIAGVAYIPPYATLHNWGGRMIGP